VIEAQAEISEAQRTRVVMLGTFPPQTQGISGYCGALAEALSARVTVHAIGFKSMYPTWLFPGVKGAMDPTASIPRAPDLTVSHALAWYNPFAWCWYAWRSSGDVLHLQWWSLPLLPICLTFVAVARARGAAVVVTAHNVLSHERSFWFLRASRFLYRLSDHVVVHSNTNRDQIIETFAIDPVRLSMVPMGVHAENPDPMDKICAREALLLPTERPTLLFFGIIRPYKGLDILLRALAHVRESHPDVLLVIAGQVWGDWKPYLQRIEDLSLQANLHVHNSFVPEGDVEKYFAAADLAVLPYTQFDAQSAVGVQALSFGRPLVVTKTGGLPDLVGGEEGYCVPPRDVAALAEALVRFLDRPESAAQRFQDITSDLRESMSWAGAAVAHAEIYRSVRRQHGSPTR
jgi:glycosyltransferase involved in cell wall biosynthesis